MLGYAAVGAFLGGSIAAETQSRRRKLVDYPRSPPRASCGVFHPGQGGGNGRRALPESMPFSVRRGRAGEIRLTEYDWRPDPPWQRDGILLLAYVGVETLLRGAATGYVFLTPS